MNTSSNLPYLIIELANAHAGSYQLMKESIKSFDSISYPLKGIKFQVFSPRGLALEDFEWYPVYEELYFNASEWEALINDASSKGDVFLDIFDIYGVDILSQNIDKVLGIKLQSSILGNLEVFSALGKLDLKRKKIILNISGYELHEIQDILKDFSKLTEEIIIQIGFQSYPTKIQDTGLGKIEVLKSTFPDVPISMADHADGSSPFAIKVPVYAYLLGCSYLEKHFCINREAAKYDGFSSLEYPEIQNLCLDLQEVAIAKSGGFINPSERLYLENTIQIPVLNKNVRNGDLVGINDLIYRRTKQVGLKAPEIKHLQTQCKVLANDKAKFSAISEDDYRQAKVAIIVACRMKSSRLQKKAVIPIGSVPSVERCLLQCIAVPDVDLVILATSDLESDQCLKNHTLDGRIKFWQGDPDDVINRYLGACKEFGIDVVVRVTADCPIVSPEIIQYLLRSHFASGADYTSADICAVGTSGEVINVNALEKVFNYFGRASHSEYMTWYFQNNPTHFKVNIVRLPNDWIRDYRLTLDYSEDLDMFNALYSMLGNERRAYSLNEVFAILDRTPAIAHINNHMTLKYKTDQDLINLLNRETKMS